MKIMSFNIENLKKKCKNPELLYLIRNTDIIGFCETWLKKGVTVDITGFKNVANSYGNRRKQRGRHPAGVSVYVSSSFSGNVRLVKAGVGTWCQVEIKDMSFLICFLYRPPIDSAFANEYFFTELSDELNELRIKTGISQLFLLGDFNGRVGKIGSLCETIHSDNEDNLSGPLSEERLNSKNSEDNKVNPYGREILKFCLENELIVMNGHSRSDRNGKLTFVSPVGQSVVDYALTDGTTLMMNDPDFEVLGSTLSCHMPIIIQIPIKGLEKRRESTTDNSEGKEKLVRYRLKKDITGAVKKAKEMVPLLKGSIEPLLKKVCGNDPSAWEPVIKFIRNITELIISPSMSRIKKKIPKLKKPWHSRKCAIAKTKMKQALRIFRAKRSGTSRQEYFRARKVFESETTAAWENYTAQLADDLTKAIDTKDNRSLYEVVKTSTGNKKNSGVPRGISCENWTKHFNELLNKEEKVLPKWLLEEFCEDDDFCGKQITREEVTLALGSIKTRKAPGIWGMGGNIVKIMKDILVDVLYQVFNKILDSGTYPPEWSVAMIHPIYKNKGDVRDPASYRGISLLPTLGKLFTGIMNDRFEKWVTTNDRDSVYQSGFKKGFSTVDHCFVLDTLVTRAMSTRKPKLFTAFIDFEKCFDTVPRKALLYKLRKSGISKRFHNVLKSMFAGARFCIRVDENNRSATSAYGTGIFQGDKLSPRLFTFFLNDLFKELFKCNHAAPMLGGEPIFALAYADDICLCSTTVDGLQALLDKLNDYCGEWGLKVNTEKSFTMVFRKAPVLKETEIWKFGEEELRSVNNFKYLGIVFARNGKKNQHIAKAVASAMNGLNRLKIFRYKFGRQSVKLYLQLFDTMVQSVALYGSEIWGAGLNANLVTKLDSIRCQWLKCIIGLPNCTPNAAITLDFGLRLLSVDAKLRTFNFWFKCMNNPSDSLTKLAYEEQRRLAEAGTESWGLSIKRNLDRTGLGYLWNANISAPCIGHYTKIVATRITDIQRDNLTYATREMKSLSHYKPPHLPLKMAGFITEFAPDDRRIIAHVRYNISRGFTKKSEDEDGYDDDKEPVVTCACGATNIQIPEIWSHVINECALNKTQKPNNVMSGECIADKTKNKNLASKMIINGAKSLFRNV